MLRRKFVDVTHGVVACVVRGNLDVVHIEEQPAPGSCGYLCKKCSFRNFAFLEHDIDGRIFEQHAASNRRLNFIDVIAYEI